MSLKEGFGIPPLEAMRCECPVIVSDIEVFREVCGDAALYVNPFDNNSISQAIRSILEKEELRHNLVQKGIIRSYFFNWDKITEKIAGLLKSLS